MPCNGNIVKSANINPREIVNFRKFPKVYTRENIHIHSSFLLYVAFSFIVEGFLEFPGRCLFNKINTKGYPSLDRVNDCGIEGVREI